MVISLVLHESTQLQTISCQIHDTGKKLPFYYFERQVQKYYFYTKVKQSQAYFYQSFVVHNQFIQPFFIHQSFLLYVFPSVQFRPLLLFLPWSRFSFKGANLVCRA
ncbi:unknown [Bacteroides sp. CAG:702]|nr:unknown [Bacteroides sp. CAG:702]